MALGLLRTKSVADIAATLARSESDATTSLKRTLGTFDLVMLGIGAVIGAGIFSSIGTAAVGEVGADGTVTRYGAGPALILSFVLLGAVCALAGLCYAELTALIPISGSAYTYAYATLGEFVAWIIGWDLIIEYAVGNIAVAISWAEYFAKLMRNLGVDIPPWLATNYRAAAALKIADPAKYAELFGNVPTLFGYPIIFNALAVVIVAVITVVLVWGIKESANFNAVMVAIKILVLVFFVGVAFYYVSPSRMAANWVPFQPTGWHGTFVGAALVFFAYIGFDAVSTVAEETKNPARDLPIGIIASLIVCTVLYVIVGAVFAGLIPYTELVTKLTTEQAEPLTMALDHVATPGTTWPSTVVAFGSVIAHTAVLLVFQLGQPRIFFSMARDGLLPSTFASVHPRFKTPHVTTILTGVAVGGIAAFATIDEVIDLTNIGTLFAFILVCVGIPVLRLKDPGRTRPFRVPLGPWLLPLLGVVSCFFLIFYLPPASWWRFVGWLMLGFAIYVSYGYTRSSVGMKLGRPSRTPLALKLAGLGFLVVAVGLFIIPHDLGPRALIDAATDAAADRHDRAVYGLLMILVGLVVGVAGTALGSRGGGAAEGGER